MQKDVLSYEERLLLESYRNLDERGKRTLLQEARLCAEIFNKNIIYFPEQNHGL